MRGRKKGVPGPVRAGRALASQDKETCDGCGEPVTKHRSVVLSVHTFCQTCHRDLFLDTPIRRKFPKLMGRA